MIEHHECKKEFIFTHYLEPCRSAHARARCRLYRQRTKTTPVATTGPDCISHSCRNSGSPGINHRGTSGNCSPGLNGQKQTIKISGSTTVLPIVQKAADQYMASHPDADIQVSGGGSGVGIQAIGAKTVDIGMSSREVTQGRDGKVSRLCRYFRCTGWYCGHCEPGKQIQYITLDQIKDIYLGKITKWTQITGANVPNTNNQIVIIGRDSASGTRTYFDETVLLKATPTKTMLEKNSNGAVLQTVAQTPGSIGYVSIGFVSKDVKALPDLV